MTNETTMTVTREALIVRIPWEILAEQLRPKSRKGQLTASEVLALVKAGRRNHKAGKTRIIKSLKELQ